ncbi:MAG: tetratricopeptide repeat protein [Candidatus Eisenbacteria bacterium]|nr:tetratricopeptide repeat protein [Candidatus Eisenbacteria bacterium]
MPGMELNRRGGAPSWLALAMTLLLMGALALAAHAGKKGYRYEDDPVRLGVKAVEEGRLDDAKAHFNEAIANEHQIHRAHLGLADILHLQAAFVEAEPLYRQAITEKNQETGNPEFPEAHAGLGFVLIRLQRFAEAKQEFEQALVEKKGLWEAQYGMARIAIEDGKYDEAAKFLEDGARKRGLKEREDLYRHGMALVQYAQGDLPGAEKNALAALAINPNDPDYGTLVAEIYTKRGAPTLAIDAYEKALATPGLTVTAPVHHRLGVLYQREQRYNDALEQYRQAVRMDSTYAPAVKDMGGLYALANRNEEAATAYLAFTGLRPDDWEGFLGLSEACLKTKRNRQALDAARQAFVIDSLNADIRVQLARSEFINQDRKRAGRLYGSVTDSTKFEAADHVRMGQIRLDAKEFEAARGSLLRALEMDSTQADAFFALGLLNLTQGKPDSAIALFEKSVGLAPGNAGAQVNLGIAYMQAKRSADAIRTLRAAVALAPDYVPARNYLANALVGADSLGAAVLEYKAIRERDPQNAMALRGLGFCYIKRRDYGQAASVLDEATTVDPNSADGWAMLGQARALQGSTDQAVAALQKALAINPAHVSAKAALDALQGAKKGSAGK